jgi:hypothetical protein
MVRVILIVMLLLATVGTGHSQIVRARISSRDVEQIRAVLNRYTREPLMDITPDISAKWFPGSVPYQQPGGPLLYERTDRVHVLTGTRESASGGAYDLQKFGARWKVVFKSVWMP